MNLRCNELAKVPLKGQPGRYWAGDTQATEKSEATIYFRPLSEIWYMLPSKDGVDLVEQVGGKLFQYLIYNHQSLVFTPLQLKDSL